MQVIPITKAEIAASDAAWEWAEARKAKVQRFWKKLHAANPALFNGPIHMLADDYVIADGKLAGRCLRSDYASLLYWREEGFAPAGALNGFGSAVVLSAEGHVIFGRMAAHTANAGKVYPFGGSLDDDDIREGHADIEGSIMRELAEETGIEAGMAQREPGLLFLRDGAMACFAACFRMDAPSSAIRARIEIHLEMTEKPELDGVVIFRRAAFTAHHRMPGYARSLVEHLLQESPA